MEKFNKTLRGYNPKEVNAFLDEVIGQVEQMVAEIKQKDKQLLENKAHILKLEEQLNRYKSIEKTLNTTIVAAQDSSEQIRRLAKQESEMIVSEARKNANRIVNEALLRAEKTEHEANAVRKNVSVFKRKLRGIIETQLELVDDIEILDL